MKTTKKQELVINFINLQNQLNTLRGTTLIEMEESNINYYAKVYKGYELEERIQTITKHIAEEEAKIEKEKYWEEHQEEKQQLEERRSELVNNYREARDRYAKCFDFFFDSYGMFVKYMSTSHLEIALKENDRYHFDIYYSRSWEAEDDKYVREMEINYPCYGSFNPAKEPEFVKYLVALADFASSKQIKKDVEETLKSYNDELDAISEGIERIDNQLKGTK